jgi:exoribonuclease R
VPRPNDIDLAAEAREAMREHGFVPDFPPAVEREVAALPPTAIAADAAPGVRDLRALLWSSIDNRDSRDLDQVEYVERLDNGYLLRVGIADVDVLVARGSAADEHAANNTTSVYTGIEVFPMLPHRLSTDLTSLNEGEQRLAMVVEMEVGADGVVAREQVARCVVRNHAKLDYDRVGTWLEGDAPPPEKVAATPGLEAQLKAQDEVARLLLAERQRAGALDLDTIEPRVVVVNGRVIDVTAAPHNRARGIIENFMIAANGAVARILDARGMPAIRRVVRSPKRWERLVSLAAEMGETLPDTPDRHALADFLARRRAADPERFPDLSLTVVKLLGSGEYMLERRSRARAGEGHYGLAVAEYAHSTAPNRRFADLVTQRLLKTAAVSNGTRYTEPELLAIAQRCTLMEDAARKVERIVRKKAAAVFMRGRIGESFVAIVTGASHKGTYVRVLKPPVEGRVVRGERGLDVGDTVRVTLAAADPERGYIDFARSVRGGARKRARSRRKKRVASLLRNRIGETFEATVTSASPSGVYVRVVDERVRNEEIDGRVIRGYKSLAQGQRIHVTLVDADPVHGFIDFEYATGVEPRKAARRERKRRAALALLDRIGEHFDVEVTGVTPKATWVRVLAPVDGVSDVEARLVRGERGLRPGSRVRAFLLTADPRRGHIDLAREGT